MAKAAYHNPQNNLHSSAQHTTAENRIHYERHRPEETVLYQLVQEHIESFFAQVETETGSGLPDFVKDEFDAFLECGVLAHGFLRLRCADCTHEKLVAFSCKRRGFCPSCGGRRMAQTAAHLVDHVIPNVPVRQWVLSLPIPLRYLFAAHPHLISPVLQVISRAISTFLIKQAGFKRPDAQTGAITLIQRFGSAANLNIHLHCLVLDGVYRIQNDTVEFLSVRSPTVDQLQALLSQIIKRVMKALTRHGALIEEEGMTYLADIESDAALAPLQSAACTYRIALGPRAGQKLLTLKTVAAQNLEQSGQEYCANAHGFSLHAGVRYAMNQRNKLERLCRYITRPAIADERLARNKDGQIVLTLKTPYRDGTTHIVLSPVEFMQRLAALVPRPRLNLIRFHGVLAPNAKLRAEIIPGSKKNKSHASNANDAAPPSQATVRISWARLLKRVFEIDIERCPHCGGNVKIIAAILERTAITKILDHLGLPARAPPRAPAQIFDPFEPT
ncbi:MAG: IS91 family transposase [Nitrosomonas sp.]|uniref:IS91 family transposase n=1 Tax=Nitrosomonas sp. TaxID=42353 RepID=UPI0027351FC1|nr:IS91 family transposase [Nitrosomonas sp.]MDP3662818.1 IS91 family transposase [Nitrosomonas sp.]